MKKFVALLLSISLLLGLCSSALALNYSGNLGNPSTFETMAEARANGPAAMTEIMGRGSYASHPALANYPGETTYIYRSADMYGRNAAVRLNTNIAVFTDESFADKDAALAYLKELGLVDIIEEAIGSIILVTPSDPAKGFTAADQKFYYGLQTALFDQGGAGMVDGKRVTYVEPVYYGGYSFYYGIGIGGGATFFNNYIAGTLDYVSRFAGVLLIDGKMDRIREVADLVPVYLVNAPESVVAKYEAANSVDALLIDGDKTISYNQQFPLRKVVVRNLADANATELVKDAYYSLFVKAQRAQALLQGLHTASTPYQGYNQDSAPYSLAPRNAIINGKTEDGIYLTTVYDAETFAGIKTDRGEYLDTWYEYLPEEIVNGTAADGSIPLLLCNHGGGDDPRQFVDGQGFLELAGAERLAIIAPYHQGMGYGNNREECNDSSVLQDVLPEFVRYILDKYPALDASRVYVTGYSMGAGASIRSIYGDASVFAAAVPMAVGRVAPLEKFTTQFKDIDIPIMITGSEYDMAMLNIFKPEEGVLGPSYYYMLDLLLGFNEIDPLPTELDFDKYPISGFGADIYREYVMNDEYTVYEWMYVNDAGVPMVSMTITESLLHALYPDYAYMFWDFVKHYSRDPETLEISYDPYIR